MKLEHKRFPLAVGKILERALPRMAAVAFQAGGVSDATANQLDKAGSAFIDGAIAWLADHYRKGEPWGNIGPPLERLRNTFNKIKDRAVDDFRHGMSGDQGTRR